MEQWIGSFLEQILLLLKNIHQRVIIGDQILEKIETAGGLRQHCERSLTIIMRWGVHIVFLEL